MGTVEPQKISFEDYEAFMNKLDNRSELAKLEKENPKSSDY